MVDDVHNVRLNRVESEVGSIRTDVNELKTQFGLVQSDVKSLGGILTRIEQGFVRSQDQQDQRDLSSKHSPVAIVTVVFTALSIMVGGAWTIGSQSARTEVRLNDQDVLNSRVAQHQDREFDAINRRIDRLEDKVTHGATRDALTY